MKEKVNNTSKTRSAPTQASMSASPVGTLGFGQSLVQSAIGYPGFRQALRNSGLKDLGMLLNSSFPFGTASSSSVSSLAPYPKAFIFAAKLMRFPLETSLLQGHLQVPTLFPFRVTHPVLVRVPLCPKAGNLKLGWLRSHGAAKEAAAAATAEAASKMCRRLSMIRLGPGVEGRGMTWVYGCRRLGPLPQIRVFLGTLVVVADPQL